MNRHSTIQSNGEVTAESGCAAWREKGHTNDWQACTVSRVSFRTAGRRTRLVFASRPAEVPFGQKLIHHCYLAPLFMNLGLLGFILPIIYFALLHDDMVPGRNAQVAKNAAKHRLISPTFGSQNSLVRLLELAYTSSTWSSCLKQSDEELGKFFR